MVVNETNEHAWLTSFQKRYRKVCILREKGESEIQTGTGLKLDHHHKRKKEKYDSSDPRREFTIEIGRSLVAYYSFNSRFFSQWRPSTGGFWHPC